MKSTGPGRRGHEASPGAEGVARPPSDPGAAGDEDLGLILSGMMEGFAHCRMLYDDRGRPDDFVYLRVNPAFCTLTGMEDPTGKRVTEVLPTVKTDTPELFEIYGGVVATGEPAEFEIDFTPLERWLHVSATRPREGEFVAFFYDVSGRVAAARAAEEGESRLRRSLAAAGAGTWEWDLESGANTWSEELWRLYDLDPTVHTASYEAWLESVHHDDRERAAASVVAASGSGGEIDLEYRVNTRDGSVRWLFSRGSPERNDQGEVVRYLGVVVDVTERKQATTRAREREESYSAIFHESPNPMALLSLERGVLDANQAFLDMVGGERDAVVGRGVANVATDESMRRRVMGILERDGVVRDLELVREGAPGAPATVVSLDLSPVTVAGERLLLAVYRDVTAQRLAEDATREGRAKLDAALASTSDAVFISDVDGTFVDFNDGFATFHKFASREECATTLAEYPEFLDVFMADGTLAPLEMWAVPRALRGEVGVDVEYGLRRKDTGEEWIGSYSFAPIRDAAGQVTGSVVVGRDITARKQTERDLRESEERFRALFESSPVGVFFTLPDGTVLRANAAACDRFGYSEEELRALGRQGLFCADDPRLAAALEERARAGAVTGAEMTCVRRGGSEFPVEVDSVIIPGDSPRSFVMVRDVTEHVRLEDDLRRLNADLEERVRLRTAELERANAELEAFSYSVSHDLRAPLRRISGFATLLKEQLDDEVEPEARHFLERITAAADDMGALIDDLLQFSRIGRAEMVVERVDMESLVGEVLEALRDEAPERRVSLSVGPIPPARGDPALLQQVWANVLDNAFKYTRGRDVATIEIGSRPADGETVYWVRDNGVGFDQQYADRLYRVFERLHRPEDFEGTGIGLANVQRIVARHGGRCWAEAEVDKGATFFFALPAGEEE